MSLYKNYLTAEALKKEGEESIELSDFEYKSALTGFCRELGHYWGVYIKRVKRQNANANWPTNVDLFSGNTHYNDFLSLGHWVTRDKEKICVAADDPDVQWKFSKLSLYLMGLLSPDQVPPVHVHEFNEKPADPAYNSAGPACHYETDAEGERIEPKDKPNFTKTKTVTINEIMAYNGVRQPAYDQSQKDFSVVFVILLKKGETPPRDFLNLLKKIQEDLPEIWFDGTNGKSKLTC